MDIICPLSSLHSILMNQPISLNPPCSVTGLVLAGGQSRRMGTDKALLCWEGVSMLKRVCDVALQCCEQVSILTPWPERYQQVIPPGCFLLQEDHPGRGPLVALSESWQHLHTPWVLLLACDLPLLQANILKAWLTLLSPSQTLAVVPHQAGQWEPLCGFYHAQSRASLQSFLQQGGQSFQQWLSTIPTQKIALDAQSKQMLRNCNCPADLIPSEV